MDKLYAQNKVHNLDRYESGYTSKNYNKSADRFSFGYDSFNDAVNISIRGDIAEYNNALSEIDNNISAFKLNKKDIDNFIDKFVENNSEKFIGDNVKLIVYIDGEQMSIDRSGNIISASNDEQETESDTKGSRR